MNQPQNLDSYISTELGSDSPNKKAMRKGLSQDPLINKYQINPLENQFTPDFAFHDTHQFNPLTYPDGQTSNLFIPDSIPNPPTPFIHEKDDKQKEIERQKYTCLGSGSILNNENKVEAKNGQSEYGGSCKNSNFSFYKFGIELPQPKLHMVDSEGSSLMQSLVSVKLCPNPQKPMAMESIKKPNVIPDNKSSISRGSASKSPHSKHSQKNKHARNRSLQSSSAIKLIDQRLGGEFRAAPAESIYSMDTFGVQKDFENCSMNKSVFT